MLQEISYLIEVEYNELYNFGQFNSNSMTWKGSAVHSNNEIKLHNAFQVYLSHFYNVYYLGIEIH